MSGNSFQLEGASREDSRCGAARPARLQFAFGQRLAHDITKETGSWQAVGIPSENELRFAHTLGEFADCMIRREHSCKLHGFYLLSAHQRRCQNSLIGLD